jgi:hypothetical protein
MKRRSFVQALAAIPAAAPLALPQQAPPTPAPTSLNPARGEQPPGRAAAEELPKLEATLPEAVGEAMPRFFTPVELGTLRKLSDILMPATASSPGAVAAQAPEFLDFLIGDSGADRKQLYRAGLDGLNAQARRQFSKAFADLDASQASALLAPLRQPWTSRPGSAFSSYGEGRRPHRDSELPRRVVRQTVCRRRPLLVSARLNELN